MELTQKFLYQSNYWYNDGLERAKVRDMSGAIRSLKHSLKYNRDNVPARNLLGLTYYGCGEAAEAVIHWIISRSIQPRDNLANYYIKRIQQSPNELERQKQAIHKYNQCLAYCRQNGEDLAIIQLKKVIASHPTFLKAYQLLGLLYLTGKEYSNARQVLRKAHKLDNANPITLRYMYELNRVREKKPIRLKENKPQTVSYSVGNETVIQPANPDSKEKARISILLNLLIGAVMGVAVLWFLIIPQIQQSKAFQTNDDIVAYSDEIASQNAEISALKTELDTYRNASEESESAKETAKSTQASYELLLKVKEQYDSQTVSNADMAESLGEVNREALGEGAKALYDTLVEVIYPSVLETRYTSGKASYDVAEYETAAASFQGIIDIQEDYNEGKALLYLANSYARSGDTDKAEEVYQKLLDLMPDTDIAAKAQKGIDGDIPEVEDTQ